MLDINCDMGESFGAFNVGNDEALFPLISSCNIACGFHGGDPLHIENTIKKALEYGLRIGAHPSYPDLAGFGRRKMQISSKELKAILKYQIAALKGMTESLGGKLEYVKPHGALYNFAAKDRTEAAVIMAAIREIDNDLILMGLAGSEMEKLANDQSFPFIAEAFGDRKYTEEGSLLSRSENGAIIQDASMAMDQIFSIFYKNEVITQSNKAIQIKADSICVHGDNPAAIEILLMLKKELKKKNLAFKQAR